MAHKWFSKQLQNYRDEYFSTRELPIMDLFMFTVLTSLAISHFYLAVFRSDLHAENIQQEVHGRFSFAHYIDIPTCCIPAISAFCLLMKRKEYSKMVRNINTIGESLGIRITSPLFNRLHWIFATVLLFEIIYELSNEWCHMINTISVYSYYLFACLKWHVVWQLANRFHILRFYFGQVTEQLNIRMVEKFVKYHEILRSCCLLLWECYKIQMSVIIVYIFILFVCNVYLIIDSYSRQRILEPYHYIYIFWTILYCSFIWIVVYSCAATKNMVRKRITVNPK